MATLICPHCQFEADSTLVLKWGDGVQRTTVAPYICTECAEVSIANLVTMTVESMPSLGWDLVRERNPRLWQEITAAQERVRAAIKATRQ